MEAYLSVDTMDDYCVAQYESQIRDQLSKQEIEINLIVQQKCMEKGIYVRFVNLDLTKFQDKVSGEEDNDC